MITLFYASACLEHYVLVTTGSKLCYTASGIITPVGGLPVHRLRDDSTNSCYIIRFIICLYMFRALCAHHQTVETVLYSIWYHHTCGFDDTRCCIIQF